MSAIARSAHAINSVRSGFAKTAYARAKKHIADNVSYIVAHRAVKGEFGVDHFYAVFIYKNRAGM